VAPLAGEDVAEARLAESVTSADSSTACHERPRPRLWGHLPGLDLFPTSRSASIVPSCIAHDPTAVCEQNL